MKKEGQHNCNAVEIDICIAVDVAPLHNAVAAAGGRVAHNKGDNKQLASELHCYSSLARCFAVPMFEGMHGCT